MELAMVIVENWIGRISRSTSLLAREVGAFRHGQNPPPFGVGDRTQINRSGTGPPPPFTLEAKVNIPTARTAFLGRLTAARPGVFGSPAMSLVPVPSPYGYEPNPAPEVIKVFSLPPRGATGGRGGVPTT